MNWNVPTSINLYNKPGSLEDIKLSILMVDEPGWKTMEAGKQITKIVHIQKSEVLLMVAGYKELTGNRINY